MKRLAEWGDEYDNVGLDYNEEQNYLSVHTYSATWYDGEWNLVEYDYRLTDDDLVNIMNGMNEVYAEKGYKVVLTRRLGQND